MSVYVQTEINLERVVRTEVTDPCDLARLALTALDSCADRLAAIKDTNAAAVVRKARADLGKRLEWINWDEVQGMHKAASVEQIGPRLFKATRRGRVGYGMTAGQGGGAYPRASQTVTQRKRTQAACAKLQPVS